MIFTNKEKGIIDVFYKIIIDHLNDELIFEYDNCKIVCYFETAYETDNCLEEVDPNYEEYFAICFKRKEDNKLFEVCYHNIPNAVYVDDQMIFHK